MAMVAYRHDYVGLDDGRHGHGFDALFSSFFENTKLYLINEHENPAD